MFRAQEDAYGELVAAYYRGEDVVEIVERDDGFIEGTGWTIHKLINSEGPPCIAVLEKE